MSTVQCPNGHASESTDYCDVCGTPIATAPVAADPRPATAAPTTTACANCGAPAAAGAPQFAQVVGAAVTVAGAGSAATGAGVIGLPQTSQ